MQNDPEDHISSDPESVLEASEESKQREAEHREQLRLKLLSERELLGKGVIYRAYSKKIEALMTIPLVLVGGFSAVASVILLVIIISYPPGIAVLIFQKPHYIILFIILPYVFEVVWFKYIVRGYACDYEANQTVFSVTRKGKPILSVIYKNAVSVKYKPMKYLWFDQGFHVTIKMKTYSLKFDYVVPRAMRFHHDNFPFEIIIQEIVRREIGEQNAE
ncbi:MAG: hypothetical protein J1F03_06845 [Oscillospiraceae bacterium]|nr:hypothetical protein [Oscillospiraceae bacterium]